MYRRTIDRCPVWRMMNRSDARYRCGRGMARSEGMARVLGSIEAPALGSVQAARLGNAQIRAYIERSAERVVHPRPR